VHLIWDEQCHTATAEGNGPVDAAINAVKEILKKKVRIEEFLIQAITRGSDDMGKGTHASGTQKRGLLRIFCFHRYHYCLCGGFH
jgi:hypothetical protein